MMKSSILLSILACSFCCPCNATSEHLVGLGKADITGPVVDVNMMGYANPSQIAGGIHTRLFARAVVVAEHTSPDKRFVFVNLDACMASQAVTFTIIQRLKARYGPNLYSEQNVALSGTHTHSGPAGYLQYLVYDVTGLGFVPQTFNALVDGIEQAIMRAHEALRPGRLSFAIGELLGANINRSPTAYMENPAEERAAYAHNVDKDMTLLRVEDTSGAPLGVFSWFPVHGTSMNNTNELINGDNKGAAAQFMERWARDKASQWRPDAAAAATSHEFIAAFCQANVGDTSPNTLGPVCMDTGEPCDVVHSTCGGRVKQCIGRGPGWPDHFNSTRIIATKQAEKAQELLENDGVRVDISGPVESRHVFLDMRNLQVMESPFTRPGRACTPAMGFAFAAGTTDGPGAFDFTQSDTNGTAFWRLVRNFIRKPSPAQEACHAPKPILLDVGDMHFPYEWVPYIVEIQILRVGQFAILAVPGEFTTTSGRRLRRAVLDIVGKEWGPNVTLVIAGLTNTYSSYITTYEEYQAQRYEGGFTLYGPSTLDAYIQEFRKLAKAMVDKQETAPGPLPPNQLTKQWSLVPGVVADGVPYGVNFGDVSQEVNRSVFYPGQRVEVEFHSGCPRNDIRAGGTFLTVERRVSSGSSAVAKCWRSACAAMARLLGVGPTAVDGKVQQEEWEVVHTDSDWETRFYWRRHESLSTRSFALITWDIPHEAQPGTYRIRHFGNYKHFFGQVYPFQGSSSTFEVREGSPEERNPWTVFMRGFSRQGLYW